MKKIISFIVTLILVLNMAIPSFAINNTIVRTEEYSISDEGNDVLSIYYIEMGETEIIRSNDAGDIIIENLDSGTIDVVQKEAGSGDIYLNNELVVSNEQIEIDEITSTGGKMTRSDLLYMGTHRESSGIYASTLSATIAIVATLLDASKVAAIVITTATYLWENSLTEVYYEKASYAYGPTYQYGYQNITTYKYSNYTVKLGNIKKNDVRWY